MMILLGMEPSCLLCGFMFLQIRDIDTFAGSPRRSPQVPEGRF